MGFTRKKQSQETKQETKEAKRPRDSTDKFVPSTDADLKQYAKSAKKRMAQRAESKANRRSARMLHGSSRIQYRDMFARHDTFDILGNNTISKFIEHVRENGDKPPRYREYLPRKEADSRFVFEINTALARMSWIQLSELVSVSVGFPVVTKEYTEAYNFAAHALLTLALGVADEKGVYKVTDLSALESWPVESMKRPSKEERMSKREAADVAKGKVKAKKAAEEEDEDETTEEVEEEVDEEDGEETEDADEKPAKKKGRGKHKQEPEDSDDEDDDESEDESEDDESEDEEDEDEEDEEFDDDEDAESEDEDEEEDKKPTKRGATKAAKETDVKKAKGRSRPEKMELKKPVPKVRKVRAEKADKAKVKVRAARGNGVAKFTPNTVLAKVKDRPKGGPKTKVLNLMPKKGIKLSALEKAAKEEGLNVAKVATFAQMMVKRGFAKVVE